MEMEWDQEHQVIPALRREVIVHPHMGGRNRSGNSNGPRKKREVVTLSPAGDALPPARLCLLTVQ